MQSAEVMEIEKAFKPGQKDDEGNPLPLGSIKVRVGGGDSISGNILHRWARPAFFGNRRIPLKGEHVLIFPAPVSDATDGIVKASGYYYLSPFNATDDLVLHQLPMVFWRQKGNTPAPSNTIVPGKSFPKNPPKIDFLQPFEGDELYESRLGSSMRFGSAVTPNGHYSKKPTWTGPNAEPITIFRVSKPQGSANPNYTVEDISSDDSSIYMTTSQKLTKLKAGFAKNLDAKKLATFGSPQIVVHSDRVVVNAVNDSAYVIGSKSVIVTGKEIQLQSDKYNVKLDDLMEYIKMIVTKVNDLTSGTKMFATPAGPTATATSAPEWVKLLNVDFKTKFEMP